jgi:predicted acyltransferase
MEPPTGRLVSLDVFRGITIAAMILVNDPGDGPVSYLALRHTEWNGWTPTDLVFPFFLFIVGVAMAFSLRSRLERGSTRGQLFRHVLWRAAVLFAIGVFLNGFPSHYNLAHLRIYGVLQRIAICYAVTAVLELWTGWRTQFALAITCVVGYWLMMRYIPVPGFGVPGRNIPLLDPDRNLVAWLDRKLLIGHLYERTRDPEGALSTIPALATSLFGLLAGKWLRSVHSPRVKTFALVVTGVAAIVAGKIMNVWFPINKKLWTSSFVVFTAGVALIGLAVCYWVVDVKKRRGRLNWPTLVFGTNAIAAYFFSEALAVALYSVHIQSASDGKVSLQEYIYTHLFAPVASPANASLLYALVYVAVCWALMAALYCKGVFIKI